MTHPFLTRLLLLLCLLPALHACESELGPKPAPHASSAPEERLQQVASQLVERSGAPGALLGVAHGKQRWLLSAGHQDLLGLRDLPTDGIFRAGSITKLFTGALVMRAVEQGRLSLEDRLASYLPSFPRASDITVDMLLSHTGGVTTSWFDGEALQAEVTRDLSRAYTPEEVIARLAQETPLGEPGESGMHYSNLDFVLLGQILAQLHQLPIGEIMQRELFAPLGLGSTSYTFDNPEGLISGYLTLGGLPFDGTSLPQRALVSFAGSAGAVHSNVADLLTFMQALFRDRQLLSPSSLARMMQPAEAGSWYGRALMRFCPCRAGVADDYSGFGHGGNLPGYWSVAVYYPALDLAIVAAINRDSNAGVPLDRTIFDPTLQAVVDTFSH